MMYTQINQLKISWVMGMKQLTEVYVNQNNRSFVCKKVSVSCLLLMFLQLKVFFFSFLNISPKGMFPPFFWYQLTYNGNLCQYNQNVNNTIPIHKITTTLPTRK